MVRKSKREKKIEEMQEFLKPSGTGFLRIEDGESEVVYFTEDYLDVPKAWRHGKRIQYRGRWHEFSCLGANCPLCEHPDETMRRKSRKWRFVVVTQDNTIALRDFGITFMNQLSSIFEEEDTILDIPFKISRSGTGRNTRWTVVPVKKDKYPKPKEVSKSDIEEANEAAHKEYEERDPDEIQEILKVGFVGKDIVTRTEDPQGEGDPLEFLEVEEEENNAW